MTLEELDRLVDPPPPSPEMEVIIRDTIEAIRRAFSDGGRAALSATKE